MNLEALFNTGTYPAIMPVDVDGSSEKMEARACFNNAMMDALHNGGDFHYGYAVSIVRGVMLPFPIEHAWVMRKGMVVDRTWTELQPFGIYLSSYSVSEERLQAMDIQSINAILTNIGIHNPTRHGESARAVMDVLNLLR